jgi:hypothetical protein
VDAGAPVPAVAPVPPVEPVTPVAPADHGQPAEPPVEPVTPVAPVEPGRPVEPPAPTESTEPPSLLDQSISELAAKFRPWEAKFWRSASRRLRNR